MSSKSSSNIASKAYSKAEADFSTWLMMAKLGSFDDLPSNAQNFLTSYRDRLETMSEAESTVLAIREVYSAYYSEMGGVGAAARTAYSQTNQKEPTAQTSARSICCAPFDHANDPKISPGPADFREPGGLGCDA